MKRLLSIAVLLGLMGLGLNLAARQSSPSQDQAGSLPHRRPGDAANPEHTARTFEGKIAKSDGKLVLLESSTQTAYQVDDQDKAKEFQGKTVKVVATLDENTNTLHIVDIAPADSR